MCEGCVKLLERLGDKCEELGYAKEIIRGLIHVKTAKMRDHQVKLAEDYLKNGYRR